MVKASGSGTVGEGDQFSLLNQYAGGQYCAPQPPPPCRPRTPATADCALWPAADEVNMGLVGMKATGERAIAWHATKKAENITKITPKWPQDHH